MRRTILLLTAAVMVLAFGSGAVLAASIICAGGDCVGTRAADEITGTADDDLVAGLEGNDAIRAGEGYDIIYADEGDATVIENDRSPGSEHGVDIVYGDEGNDTIDVQDLAPGSQPDEVQCGPGKRDKVTYDKGHDKVARDCEIKRVG